MVPGSDDLEMRKLENRRISSCSADEEEMAGTEGEKER